MRIKFQTVDAFITALFHYFKGECFYSLILPAVSIRKFPSGDKLNRAW